MCGEKIAVQKNGTRKRGSPPHVRGKGTVGPVSVALAGITPACAGKRILSGSTDMASRDHPRMCGEKIEHLLRSSKPAGSPPHVRGKGVIQ